MFLLKSIPFSWISWLARSGMPSPDNPRNEIAKCSEKAYAFLPLSDAVTLLYFKTQDEVISFAKERHWIVDPKSKLIQFGDSKAVEGLAKIPVDEIIHNVLSYAKELERIV